MHQVLLFQVLRCRLLCISHLQHVTNTKVLRWTNQSQLSTVLCDRCLQLFGHVARSDAWMDHSTALHTVTELLETSSGSTQRDMDANHRERSESTQHQLAHVVETSAGSWTMATNCGSSSAPTWGLPLMMMMMMMHYYISIRFAWTCDATFVVNSCSINSYDM